MLFKILAASCSVVGAIILAWRVKKILDILILAQQANDTNFRTFGHALNNQLRDAMIIVGMDEQVERQQRRGITLLVFGFLFLALGGVFNTLSILYP